MASIGFTPDGQAIGFIKALKTEPGTMVKGLWAIGTNPLGEVQGIPVFVVQGSQPGPTLWVQATVHGEEFPASWAVSTLAREIDPQELQGRVILFPIMHLHAFLARQKTSPIDGLDISHEFPGSPGGSFTQQAAYAISQALPQEADAMIDVHSGDSSYVCIEFATFPSGLAGSKQAEEMALSTGSQIVLRRHPQSEAERHYGFIFATAHGIPGLMISAGGHRRVEPQFFGALVRQCQNVMRHLGMIPGDPPRLDPSQILENIYLLKCTKSGFLVNQVENGDWVEKGQLLVRIVNIYGEQVEGIRCPVDRARVIETSSGVVNAGEMAIELFGSP